MEQITNYNCKIDFILSNDTSLIQPSQTIVKSKYKKKKCDECSRRRKPAEENPKICHLKIFYGYSSKRKNNYEKYSNFNSYVCKYFGITQDPNSQEIIIIMPYYDSGDLISHIANCFHNVGWYEKLENLKKIIQGLASIHDVDIIHMDFHSGNIFFGKEDIFFIEEITIGDLGISKSATDSSCYENYGIIPYMAPEIFRGRKYTKASDIYSFGMIMWELMTGRRPFWNRSHDTELIINICDGLRPPIVTNAPNGYIELMEECWHSDPEKRPHATDIYDKIDKIYKEESKNCDNKNPTEIVKSSDIGPVTNNPNAIYKSRNLSGMIQSAMSLRSSRSQSINLELFNYYQKNNMGPTGKRKYENDLIQDKKDNDCSTKRKKLVENENNDYITNELELDIDINISNEYITVENDFDISF
ncbi:unnamed protein product [Rhizophagus irregularis]|nr:unnamed protein product [Rhizophagus irregularis]